MSNIDKAIEMLNEMLTPYEILVLSKVLEKTLVKQTQELLLLQKEELNTTIKLGDKESATISYCKAGEPSETEVLNEDLVMIEFGNKIMERHDEFFTKKIKAGNKECVKVTFKKEK